VRQLLRAQSVSAEQQQSTSLKRSASSLDDDDAAPRKRVKENSSTAASEKHSRRQLCDGLASEHGGHCRGVFKRAASMDNEHIATWQCRYGHQFEMAVAEVQDGEWCTACFKWQMLLEEGRELALARSGTLITEDMSHYGVSRGFMIWLCHRGHRFEMSVTEVRNNQWCNQCVNEAQQQRLLEQRQSQNAAQEAQQAHVQARMFEESRKRQAAQPKPAPQPVRKPAAKPRPKVKARAPQMPSSVPADAKYTLEQLQLVFKVMTQPAYANHNYKAMAGINPTDSKQEVQKKLRGLLAKLHPDKNPAPQAIDAFQRLNQVRDQMLGSLR